MYYYLCNYLGLNTHESANSLRFASIGRNNHCISFFELLFIVKVDLYQNLFFELRRNALSGNCYFLLIHTPTNR